MKTSVCFCGYTIDISDDVHVWKLIPFTTIQELEPKLNDPDGADLFLVASLSRRGSLRQVVYCPNCNGLDISELGKDRFISCYKVPKKHYELYHLDIPDKLGIFSCTCGKLVEVKNLQNQWIMIYTEEVILDNVVNIFENKGSVEEFYSQLYMIGKRAITCPHCLGITTVDCDSKGNGLKADYYARKGERLGGKININNVF